MKFLRLPVLFTMFLFAGVAQAQDRPGEKTVGILPVFDSSGEPYGQVFSQGMTAMLFQKLEGAPFRALLLNPGGLYSPIIPESIVDYAQSTKVDLVLVTTFPGVDKPSKGDFVLHVAAKLMDPHTGKEASLSEYTFAIPRRDAFFDTGFVRSGHSLFVNTFGPSRPFPKQPLGKAASAIADSLVSQILLQVAASKSDTQAMPKSGTCTITFGVNYVSKKATSKAYDIIVNGEDESLWTKEGVTKLENLKSGPIFVQVSVADAPYRLPVQDLYQANTVLDCAQPERTVTLDIGPVGDAQLHWR